MKKSGSIIAYCAVLFVAAVLVGMPILLLTAASGIVVQGLDFLILGSYALVIMLAGLVTVAWKGKLGLALLSSSGLIFLIALAVHLSPAWYLAATADTPEELFQVAKAHQARLFGDASGDWHLRAAEAGHPLAQLIVADDYLSYGGGLERDPEKARYWYEKAASQGDVSAKEALRVFFNDRGE